MAPAKSEFAQVLDGLQAKLGLALKQWGFRRRGRTFNRTTSDGLTEVVNLQMGSFDPPGMTYIPGLRENLYGKFAVNLGVSVPEVVEQHGGKPPKAFIHDYHCCVRARLGHVGPEGRDIWWDLQGENHLAEELEVRLSSDAIPFLRRLDTRDKILTEYSAVTRSSYAITPPRIVCAIILVERGRIGDARALLAAQAKGTITPDIPHMCVASPRSLVWAISNPSRKEVA